jgi:sugar phosphate permease
MTLYYNQLSSKTKLLLWGANIWYFGEGLLGPLLAIYTEKIGGDILDISWAWASFLIATGLFYIITGRWINRKSDKTKQRLLVFSYGLNALFTFGYIFISSPAQLFVLQAMLGVSEAIGSPTWDSLYSKSLKDSHDGYAWGLAGGQSQIITGVSVLIGGFMVFYFSFNLLFIIMGIIQIIATIIQAKILFQPEVISKT